MAKFSKRHYLVLSDAIRSAVLTATVPENAGIDRLSREIGTALATDNPAFNWERFAAAAHLTKRSTQ